MDTAVLAPVRYKVHRTEGMRHDGPVLSCWSETTWNRVSGLDIRFRESTARAEPAECLQPLAPTRRDGMTGEALRLEQRLSQRDERKVWILGIGGWNCLENQKEKPTTIQSSKHFV